MFTQAQSFEDPIVMIVDDDANLLSGIKRHLRKDFNLRTYAEPQEALKPDNLRNVAVVVADMRMPGIDGITLLQKISEIDPTIQRMMLTGDADQTTAVKAMNEGGVSRFFNKPCLPSDLIAGLNEGLRRYELEHAEKDLLEQTLSGSIKMLVDILSMTQPEAFGAASRQRKLAQSCAKVLGIKPAWAVDVAAMLLPLGWVAIPPAVQNRYHAGDALTPQELDMIAHIPQTGADLVNHIPRLTPVVEILRHSTRPYDGCGMEDGGPTEGSIPRGARLLKILTDLDHLTEGADISEDHLTRLVQRGARYDQAMLETLRPHLIAVSGKAGAQAKEYLIKDLFPGLELLSDLKTVDGKLILAAGKELSAVHVSRLKNFARMTPFQEPVLCQPTVPHDADEKTAE